LIHSDIPITKKKEKSVYQEGVVKDGITTAERTSIKSGVGDSATPLRTVTGPGKTFDFVVENKDGRRSVALGGIIQQASKAFKIA